MLQPIAVKKKKSYLLFASEDFSIEPMMNKMKFQ